MRSFKIFYSSPNFIKVMKSRGMRQRNVKEMRNADNILVGNPEDK
jgi:hypothetical protein